MTKPGRRRVAVVTSHPVQYQVPWLRALSGHPDVDVTVLYSMVPDAKHQGDGFGIDMTWDIPLLGGYRHEVLTNVSRQPSVSTFRGCDTPDIGRRLEAGRYDAVIVHGWTVKSCVQAVWACRRRGIPCIVRGETNGLRRRQWWKVAAHRLLFRQYDAFLAIGERNRDYYIRNGVPEKRIFWTPYGVDNQRFGQQTTALESRRRELRDEFGLPREGITLLFCGKLIPKKRPMDLLRAVAIANGPLNSARVNLTVLVVGDGELMNECRQFARDRKLPVTFAGFLNQTAIVKAYVASDCLVVPSDSGETWGLVVNEAMACGRPALTSDQVGCAPDLVIPGRTGEVFPMGRVDRLSETIVSVASNSERLRKMGAEARCQVATYSVERVVEGCTAAVRYVTDTRIADRRRKAAGAGRPSIGTGSASRDRRVSRGCGPA